MSIQNLDKLAALIRDQRDALITSWRVQVRELPSARHLDVPTLDDHVPLLLDGLVFALESATEETIPEALIGGSPPIHGVQRHQVGFDIAEVVAEYNVLRGCIHGLAEENGIALTGKAFKVLNRFLDRAIGLAVQSFAADRALEVQRRREEYLAFVAHDLRTPLNAISLAAHVLELKLSGRSEDGGVEAMLKTLHRNVGNLEALVERVLKESAHIESMAGIKLEYREFDLWPLVESLLHELEPVAATASTALINEIPMDLTAYADAGLLRRIFQNLIGNAIKYTPRGTVVIGARGIGANGPLECWVSDDGAGIAPERRDKIFDKRKTDTANGAGTGLGLAIVRTFVEAHGGKVTVDSEQGVGSTFRFTLPGRSDAA
jgi:two-component system, OmpR family, phosphate regulon sensor histidine kinase PhoR